MTQSVNLVAKAMKEYHNGDENKIQHFVRVYTLAKTIGELERLPKDTQEYLEIAALVRDIDGLDINSSAQNTAAKDLLCKADIDFDIIDRVCYIIEHFSDFDHITGLDHQILLESEYIVSFKESSTPIPDIIDTANRRFMTNYGRAFLKRAFSI